SRPDDHAPFDLDLRDRGYCLGRAGVVWSERASLRLRGAVKSPAGTPVAGIGVALTHDGRVYGTAITDARGIAQICDAPKGLVDIEVGGHLCGAVSVRYLKPYWMETRRVSVTYENCSGDDFFPYGGCLFTIRVYDRKTYPSGGGHLPRIQQRCAYAAPADIDQRPL